MDIKPTWHDLPKAPLHSMAIMLSLAGAFPVSNYATTGIYIVRPTGTTMRVMRFWNSSDHCGGWVVETWPSKWLRDESRIDWSRISNESMDRIGDRQIEQFIHSL